MKIAVDFVNTKLGSGTKTYNLNIIDQLINLRLKNKIYIFVTKNYFYQIKKIKNKNIKFIIKSDIFSYTLIRLFWMQIILPFELKLRGVNKLFSPMNISPILANLFNIKIYLALHSNLPWKYFKLMPGNFFKKYFTKKMMEWSIKLSNVLIVDSFYAKKEITNVLDINKKKIKVIYLGCNKKKNKPKKIEKNYFLSVLSCVKYHNIINLLKAYKNIKKNYNINFFLVMQILDKSYYKEIKKFIFENKLKQNVKIFINFPSNKLPSLYRNAKFYIFTSYCEVFGLTTLEAMSYNCPVLVSNRSAMPEINGKAAEYFNPDDLSEIKKKIIKMIKNSKFRKKLQKKSKKHIKKYSWKKSALETLKILKVY